MTTEELAKKVLGMILWLEKSEPEILNEDRETIIENIKSVVGSELSSEDREQVRKNVHQEYLETLNEMVQGL